MSSLPALVTILAWFVLTTSALAVDVCSYSVHTSTPGSLCPFTNGTRACVSMSAITGPCDVPLRCYGGSGFLCDLILTPKSGPEPQCPFGSRRLERPAGLRCARIAQRTLTPTRTPTPTPTVSLGCPDPDATSTPGTPPPGAGDDTLTPGPCTDADSGRVGAASGSVVVLPKIVADQARDTVVQLTNGRNRQAFAFCFYLNGLPVDPTQPPGPMNPPLLTTTAFSLHLTAQQPIQWTVSSGRPSQPGAPADPGPIPPMPIPFVGELKCVEVDETMIPIAGDALTAAATLLGPAGDVSKYDAITLRGLDNLNSDNVLELDDVEFTACPRELIFNVIADGAQNPVLGAGSTVSNRLTVVTCREDFEAKQFGTTTVSAITTDEFELSLSASFIVNGFLDIDLPGLSAAFLSSGESFRQLRLQSTSVMRCVGGTSNGAPCLVDADCAGGARCLLQSPILGVMESTHTDGAGKSGRATQNPHTCGSNAAAAITLPVVP